MKTSAFFKGLAALIFLNLLVKPVWMFFIDREVQNLVGHEEYGRYFAVLNLSYVLFFLSDAGLANMINQRIANGQQLNILRLFRLKGLLLLLYVSLSCLIGWIAQITQWDYLLYVLLIQVFTSLFILFRNILTGNQYFQADAWVSVIDKSLMVVFCGSILYTSFFTRMDLILFLQIQAFSSGIAMLIASWMLYRYRLFTKAEPLALSRLLKMILPFAIIILLMSMHYRLDGFLLERIHPEGAYQAGIYASAYRLLDASNMVGYLTASFLVSYVARHQHDRKFLNDTIIQTRHGLIFLVIGVVSFTSIYTGWLQDLLYHSTDNFQKQVMRYCMLALPGYFIVHIYGSVLTATGRFNPYIWVLVITVLLNICLNLYLIPRFGALGCCYAAIVSQYFCALSVMLTATRAFSLKVNWTSIASYVFLAVLLGGFFYFARTAGWNVLLAAFIAACLTLILLFTQVKKNFFNSLR